MMAEVVFIPELGTTLTVPADSHEAHLYATSREPVDLQAQLEDGTAITLDQLRIPSLGGSFTYRASFSIDKVELPTKITVKHTNGSKIPGPNSISIRRSPSTPKTTHRDISTCIILDPSEEFKSVQLDWLNAALWQGWAWQRVRPTWIEARQISLLENLSPELATHFILVKPCETVESCGTPFEDGLLAVYPTSTRDVFVYLSGPRGDEPPGVYARARRVGSTGKAVKAYVVGMHAASKDETTVVRDAIQLGRSQYGLKPTDFEYPSDPSPFDELGFCTWTSIGEGVRLTNANMDELAHRLRQDAEHVPIATFIIDDGWQDVRQGLNGGAETRGLWSFGTWDGMDYSLKDLVSMLKRELPSLKYVGVWMAIGGYWDSISPGSPLESKYNMKRYPIDRSNIGGQGEENNTLQKQQSSTVDCPEDSFYLLPPPEHAADFWRAYLGACKEAGVDFVKVDNQASGSFLAGVEGGQEFIALWDAMFEVANEVFGNNRVIHCMAQYERTFNGDIGMGITTDSKRIMARNSDDFGVPRRNVHRDHIHYNLYNGMLFSQLALIPDTDMFTTKTQWPIYHAVLRAYFSHTPVLLADAPGQWDISVVKQMVAQDTRGGWHLVRALETARPLARNLWEQTLDAGCGPSIRAGSSFGQRGAAIALWNAREDALCDALDVLFGADVVDALGEAFEHPAGGGGRYALWMSLAGKAHVVTLLPDEDSRRLPKMPSYATVFSDPLVAVRVAPESVQLVLAVPFWNIGGQEIAVVGLVDKYAGLAAVRSTRRDGDKLVTDATMSGNLGFIVAGDSKPEVVITVDGDRVSFAAERVGLDGDGPYLLTVDLANIPPRSGETVWTVEVCEVKGAL